MLHLIYNKTNKTKLVLINLNAGLVGRNGTGKTTFLRHMAMHAIDGIPRNCQILHVEQEVVGDDTSALQCVLNTDIERAQLLEEEAHLIAKQVRMLFFKSVEWSRGTIIGDQCLGLCIKYMNLYV